MKSLTASMCLVIAATAACSSSSTGSGTPATTDAIAAESSAADDTAPAATDSESPKPDTSITVDSDVPKVDSSLPDIDITKFDVSLPDGAADCGKCVQSKCLTEALACATDATCKKIIDCAGKCPTTDKACSAKCAADNPSTKWDAVMACTAKNCASECGL